MLLFQSVTGGIIPAFVLSYSSVVQFVLLFLFSYCLFINLLIYLFSVCLYIYYIFIPIISWNVYYFFPLKEESKCWGSRI